MRPLPILLAAVWWPALTAAGGPPIRVAVQAEFGRTTWSAADGVLVRRTEAR